ncbi:hypothetical protein FIBSPDRAFT_892097 [Athelia psychrophila]|uniref:Uncharacterized protein n=1 Tax=Athelia psychrophila TaxID=1759441 RepID=A0A166ISN0_9AGAM|nr:hypothetical protein FIBSPDRAFT_892097 [Fibularhizoctonia sp. CBS 109695]
MVANSVVSFFEPVESICGEDTPKQVIDYIANRGRQQPKIVADMIEGRVRKQLCVVVTVVHPITWIEFLPIEYDTLHTNHKHLNGKFQGFLPTSQNRHLGTFERLAEKLSPGPTLDEETAKALAEATLRHIREISPTAAFIREMVSWHPKQCAAFQDYA